MSRNNAQKAGSGKNFLLAIIGNLLPPLVSIATVPILASQLGVVGRGEVAAATAPLMLALAVSAFGIPEATVNKVANYPESHAAIIRTSLWLVVLAGIVGTLGVYLTSSYLASGESGTQANILLALTALLPSLLIAVLRSASMGLHLWGSITISRLLESVFRLLAILLLSVSNCLTVETATLVIAYAPVLAGLIFIPTLRKVRVAPRQRIRRITPLNILNFGVRLWFGGLSGVILTRISQVLMVPLASTYDLGLYVVAVSIAEVPLVINSAVREVTFSAESAGTVDERVGLASRLSTLATFSIAFFIAITQNFWLEPLFGQGFDEAAPIIYVLLLATVLGNPGSVAGAALSGRGRPGLRSISLFFAACVNLLLIIYLVPSLGAIGAAYATLIGNLIASNMNIIFLKIKFGLSPMLFYAFRPIQDGKILFAFAKKILKRGS